MKKTTLKFLESRDACKSGVEYYKTLNTTDTESILKSCVKDERYSDAMWLIDKLATDKQNMSIQIFCAELVLPNYEKEHPNDTRVRDCIEAKKKALKYSSQKNRDALNSASSAASYAAFSAASSAASSEARSAARSAASSAAWSAADSAAWSAAWSAADSAADSAVYEQIIDYSIKVLKGEK